MADAMRFMVRHVVADKGDTVANAREAAARLKEAFAGFPVDKLVFFASPAYDGPTIAAAMRDAFPKAETLGCSSAGEIANGLALDRSVVAFAAAKEVFDEFIVALSENVSAGISSVDNAFRLFESRLGMKMLDADFYKYAGLILSDSTPLMGDVMLERVGQLTDVSFVGGYAGDDMKFVRTPVFWDGRCLDNAAIFVLMRPRAGFGVIKTQSVRDAGRTVTVTRIGVDDHVIMELDRRPAAEVYAEFVGKPASKIEVKDNMAYLLGMMIDDSPYIRAVGSVNPDGSLTVYGAVREGVVLHFFKSGDIVADTARALEAKHSEMGGFSAVIDFDCAARRMEIDFKGCRTEYGRLFDGYAAAGCCTYAEFHEALVNQTAVMLAFK